MPNMSAPLGNFHMRYERSEHDPCPCAKYLLKGLELAKICKGIRLKGPYKNQFERAVLSIALNLSEGSSRRSAAERQRFYEIALGSVREVQTIIEILEIREIKRLCDQLAASAYCLCRSLR